MLTKQYVVATDCYALCIMVMATLGFAHAIYRDVFMFSKKKKKKKKKKKNFPWKLKNAIFLKFLLKTMIAVLTSTNNLCFGSIIIMKKYTPAYPSLLCKSEV